VQYQLVVPCEQHIVGVSPSGGIDWTLDLEYPYKASTPAVGHGAVFYFGTHALGQLCAAISSQIIDTKTMNTPVFSSPAIVQVGSQNVLYIGDQQWFSALNIGVEGIEPGLAHTSWPCDRGNLKRTGRLSTAFPAYLVAQLKVQVDGLHLGNYAVSLGSKLDSAQQSLAKEDLIPARNKSNAFINEVRALKGKTIPVREADLWTAAAQSIVSLLQ
jgi:hypothetical protein